MPGDGGCIRKRVFHARAEAVFAILLDAQRGGDAVGRLKADALHVLHEAIGVAGDDLPHVFAVSLVDFDGQRGGDAVALQKDHGLALLRLLGIAFLNHAGALFADARYLQQPFRLGIEHVERLFAEGADEQLGRRRADAANHAAGQVFFNAGQGRRLLDFKALHLDLAAVDRVLRPFAGDAELFARCDRRHDAHGGDARFARLDHQNGIPVFVVSEYRFIGKGFDCFHGCASSLSSAAVESLISIIHGFEPKEKSAEKNENARNKTPIVKRTGYVTHLLHSF